LDFTVKIHEGYKSQTHLIIKSKWKPKYVRLNSWLVATCTILRALLQRLLQWSTGAAGNSVCGCINVGRFIWLTNF